MIDDRPDLHEAWNIEQQRNMGGLGDPTVQWAAEFDLHHSSSNSLPTQTANAHRTSYMPPIGALSGQPMSMGMYGMNPPSFYQANGNSLFEGKGKGKEREVDFEAAFAQAAASLSLTQTGDSTKDDTADVTQQLDNSQSTDGETEDGPEFRQ